MKHLITAGIASASLVSVCFLALWKPVKEAQEHPIPTGGTEQVGQILLQDVLGSILADAIRKLGAEVSLTSEAEIAILDEVLRSNNRIPEGPLPGRWNDGAPLYTTFLVIVYGVPPVSPHQTSRTTTLENWTLQVDQVGKHDLADSTPTLAMFVTSYGLDEGESVFWVGEHGSMTYSSSSQRWEAVDRLSP